MTHARTSRTLVALALLSFAAAAAAQQLPRTVTASIAAADDGTLATGAGWRAWPVADPSALVESTPSSMIGSGRADGAWVMVPTSIDEPPALLDRVVAIEVDVADAASPHGAAGYVALLRSSRAQRFTAVPPSQLAPLPQPAAAVAGSTVRVSFDPLRSFDAPLTAVDGLEAYAIQRSPASADSYVEVGRVTARAVAMSFDDAPGNGSWRYAVRAVFAGGVGGLGASRPSPVAAIAGVACDEPSAGPVAPLLLARGVTGVVAAWQDTGASGYRVFAVTLPRPRTAPYGLATLVDTATPSATLAGLPPFACVLVSARCGAALSAAGHDSFGTPVTP